MSLPTPLPTRSPWHNYPPLRSRVSSKLGKVCSSKLPPSRMSITSKSSRTKARLWDAPILIHMARPGLSVTSQAFLRPCCKACTSMQTDRLFATMRLDCVTRLGPTFNNIAHVHFLTAKTAGPACCSPMHTKRSLRVAPNVSSSRRIILSPLCHIVS